EAGVIGVGLLGLVGCASFGNAKEGAYHAWVENQAVASETYEVGPNSFVALVDIELKYLSGVKIDTNNMSLKMDIGDQSYAEYPIGGELLWAVKDPNGEVRKYPIQDIFDSFGNIQLSEEGGKIGSIFQGYLKKSGLEDIGESMKDDLKGIVNGYLDDGKISEVEYNNLPNEFKDIILGYQGPLSLAMDSLEENVMGFPDDYVIGEIPLSDLMTFGSELYGFLDPKIKGNTFMAGNEIDHSSAKVNSSTYLEQVFRSKENPSQEIVLKKGITADGNVEFFMEMGINGRIEEGLRLGEVIDFETSSLEEILQGIIPDIPDEYKKILEGELGGELPEDISSISDEYKEQLGKILDIRLPKLSGEGFYVHFNTINCEMQEKTEFGFPINDYRLSFGLAKESAYFEKNEVRLSSSFETDIKNSIIRFTNEQTTERKITNSDITYLVVEHDFERTFGYNALAVESTEENLFSKKSIHQFTYDSTAGSDSYNEKTRKHSVENKVEFLTSNLAGVNFRTRVGVVSPYASNLGRDVDFGLLFDSRSIDASVDKNGTRGVVSLIGEGNFSKQYKEELLSAPGFLAKNPSEIKEIEREYFLKNNGIFFTFDARESTELGILLSGKNVFSHFGVKNKDVPEYFLELGGNNFTAGITYGKGTHGRKTIERYGGSLNYKTGPFNLTFDVFSDGSGKKPFYQDNLGMKVGLSRAF
ncbi:hypothetical protein ACFLTE_12340, partial [Bacteroidota bacterium]